MNSNAKLQCFGAEIENKTLVRCIRNLFIKPKPRTLAVFCKMKVAYVFGRDCVWLERDIFHLRGHAASWKMKRQENHTSHSYFRRKKSSLFSFSLPLKMVFPSPLFVSFLFVLSRATTISREMGCNKSNPEMERSMDYWKYNCDNKTLTEKLRRILDLR